MTQSPITETDLQAYVDEQLEPARRAEVDAWLRLHPADAARVQDFQRQNEALRKLFDPVLEEPVPPQWVLPEPHNRLSSGWMRMAAMLSALGVGVILGWFGRGGLLLQEPVMVADNTPPVTTLTVADSGLAHRAAIAHAVYSPDIRRPVEIGADQESQLVAWLSNRLGIKLKPPSLGALGYELIGGRLLPGAAGPVAQFMYHDASGKRLTLYVSHEADTPSTTAFQFVKEGPISVFFWIDEDMGYAISAGTDKSELAQVALTVYKQLHQD